MTINRFNATYSSTFPNDIFSETQASEDSVPQTIGAEQETSLAQSMTRNLMARVADNYLDQDAFDLINKLNSSVLQEGLRRTARNIGDSGSELKRRIEDMDPAFIVNNFHEVCIAVLKDFRALALHQQAAPLKAFLQKTVRGLDETGMERLPTGEGIKQLMGFTVNRPTKTFNTLVLLMCKVNKGRVTQYPYLLQMHEKSQFYSKQDVQSLDILRKVELGAKGA